MGKVFAITSGKGGVGKSTVAVGLSVAFCKKGRSVLLVDMDEGLRCLDLMLGIEEETVLDLADVLCGRELEDAAYSCAIHSNLKLIPAPADVGRIDAYSFAQLARDAKEKFDIVIFDFPAGIDISLYSSLPADALFLTVAVPDPVSVRDASAMAVQLSKAGLSARLVINRFVYKQSLKMKHKNIDGIIDTASLRLVGIVPESEELVMLSVKHSLKRRGKAMASFFRIAGRLDGEQLLLPKIKKI